MNTLLKHLNSSDDKYRCVKTRKLYNRKCYICMVRDEGYRSFYQFNGSCRHLVHKSCYKKYKLNSCPKCKREIYKKQPQTTSKGYMLL